MILNEFAYSLWPLLEVTKKTKSNYEGAYRRNLAPTVGEKEIAAVTKADLVNAMAHLPAQTKYQTVMCARTLFREAVERELVEANPAATVKTPKISVKPIKFLTWEEIENTNFGKQTGRIRFLALHGLRYGEAAALRPEDIYDGKVHINKSIHGLTKSIAGNRSVPYLGYFEPFAKWQNTIAEKLAPFGVTVHSLRKTYAYMLKSSAVHVTTAAKLLGHSNPMITMKIYTAVRDDEILDSGASLSQRFGLDASGLVS